MDHDRFHAAPPRGRISYRNVRMSTSTEDQSNGPCIKRGWPTPVSDLFGEINENGDSRTLRPDESSFEL